jgi:hypothetical protein
MDFMMDKITWLLNKFNLKIPSFTIPWNKLTEMMDIINPYLAQANIIFPVDTILTILIIMGSIRAVLLVIWSLAFIRKMLPF